jgi:hypothetical protein
MPLKDGIDYYAPNIQNPPDCQRMRNLCESLPNRRGFPGFARRSIAAPLRRGKGLEVECVGLRLLTLMCATSMLRIVRALDQSIRISMFGRVWVTFWS